jgi:hypothetical protein
MSITRTDKFVVTDNVVSLIFVFDVFVGQLRAKPNPEASLRNAFLCDYYLLSLGGDALYHVLGELEPPPGRAESSLGLRTTDRVLSFLV